MAMPSPKEEQSSSSDKPLARDADAFHRLPDEIIEQYGIHSTIFRLLGLTVSKECF